MIDYSKPTAQMLGRWQPFHDGHLALFKEILKKNWTSCYYGSIYATNRK
jgi:hypothetical protein